jgi:release factor glutamine methyltransferase
MRLSSTLEDYGVEPGEAAAEANMILAFVSGKSYATQVASNLMTLPEDWAEQIDVILERREKREPIQYCLGEADFLGLKFAVCKGVLIPRTDTEPIVEIVQAWVEKIYDDNSIQIADIGTGTGAIAIALAKRLPHAQLWACDISEIAVEIAELNAAQHEVTDRITVVLGDWKTYLPSNLNVIVSNPPYIPVRMKESLAREIKEYEPHEALFVETFDGTDFYRQYAATLKDHFAEKPGLLAIEMGDDQSEKVQTLFENAGWDEVTIHEDPNGLPRVLTAQVGC